MHFDVTSSIKGVILRVHPFFNGHNVVMTVRLKVSGYFSPGQVRNERRPGFIEQKQNRPWHNVV
jgi:hypothetical protein